MNNFKSKSLNSRSFYHHGTRRRRFVSHIFLVSISLTVIYVFIYDILHFDTVEQVPVAYYEGGGEFLENTLYDNNNIRGGSGSNKKVRPIKTPDNQKKFSLTWPFHKTRDIIPIDPEYGIKLSSRIKVINEVPIYQVPSGPSEPGEKYLTYLPHSQFNNQRISLENALMLAYYTNRTLILPQLILGEHRVAWLPFQQLYDSLQALNKSRSRGNCVDWRNRNICDYWDSWSLVEWNKIFGNIVRFVKKEGLRIEWSNNFSLGKLKSKYNLTNGDIHYLRDSVRYSAKIYDDPQSKTSLGVYQAKLSLEALQAIPHKLVYFETLYGTDRVLFELPEHYAFNKRMVRELVYTYPGIMSIAEKIISFLGGKGAYVGVHIRGDAYFRKAIERTIKSLTTQIEELQVSPRQHAKHPPFGTHEHCLHDLTSIPIYIATDMRRPRTDAISKQLFEMFPCVLTMSDFEPLMDELYAFVNEADGLPMKRFLLPMIDMVVAAQGKAFFGTPLSTFSRFARRLHTLYVENDEDV